MDYALERLINAPAGQVPLLDAVMVGASTSGQLVFMAVVGVWIVAALWLRSRTDLTASVSALAASGVALALNVAASDVWYRSRPFVAHPHQVTLLVAHAADASFPSDHAAAGLAIATVLVRVHPRPGLAAILFAALMSYARVYVGLHYPFDVVTGMGIGVAAGVMLLWLRSWADDHVRGPWHGRTL